MKTIKLRLLLATALAFLLQACSGGNSSGSATPPDTVNCVDRAELCAEALLDDTATKLVDNRFYGPDATSAPSLHSFMGTLQINAANMSVSDGETTGRDVFPQLSVQFLTIDDILLPLQRNVISGGTQSS